MHATITAGALALALLSGPAAAQDALPDGAGIPLWGKDTRAVLAAFLLADQRASGALAGEPRASIDVGQRRNAGDAMPAQLALGLRVELADSRSEAHGPWCLQFRVARRGAQLRSSIPVPRHTVAMLTLGTEF
ncbi:MAG TPA: hypothetical protein VFG03_19080 [Telluria sp.]|nr:hypothetical protein [Telluria sp.]